MILGYGGQRRYDTRTDLYDVSIAESFDYAGRSSNFPDTDRHPGQSNGGGTAVTLNSAQL